MQSDRQLGGWTGYYGKPGPIVMLQGWKIFQQAKHGATVMANHTAASKTPTNNV